MVYVDSMRARYGRMVMCHMVADTDEELHAMAERIGVARKWFQQRASTPHYDIALSKRALAVESGAVELDRRQMARWLRTNREKRTAEKLAEK